MTPQSTNQADDDGNDEAAAPRDGRAGAEPGVRADLLQRRQPGTAGILPNKAAEDDPARWGDGSDKDHDAWLKENKPPHWD